MSNAFSLPGAFTLGLPISVGFAAVFQIVLWRASKYSQTRPDASEVDQEALAKERAELLKAAAKKGKWVFIASLCGWTVVFQLLNYLSALFMVIVMSALCVMWAVSKEYSLYVCDEADCVSVIREN